MRWCDRAQRLDTELHLGRADDPRIQQARRLHAEVYVREGFVGDGINWIDLETGLLEDWWVAQSEYVSVWIGDEAVGLSRLITPGARTLPALEEFDLDSSLAAIPEADLLEVSSLASGRMSRDFLGIYAHLFRGLFLATLEQPERYWLAILERPLLGMLNRYFGVPFRQIGASRQLLGGETLPALLDVPSFISNASAAELRFVTTGVSFDLIDAWFRRHGESLESAGIQPNS